ncbi:MaoC/PaaZ C-terminal domain-containing protein [Rhodococcus qingshengii]|uniref:MaoC/PaaZ C-terminal domain-containing protein n=1 Tax=Rhodococcus qingshengii TaxID=334542 RepID=UPI0024BAD219|nr:MaoC/PaaZ C-terminal domain-containing protein [Rhodococcus qingshengii]MDJ0490921.1 MaoC/PaaZ C-terminal domain-containing protein [Rhodococcus qingshengii]
MSKTVHDFKVGDQWVTAGRTVTEAHVVAFAGITGDFHPLHTDEVYSSQGMFGTRIAHGPLVYAMAVGLVSQSEVFGGAVLAFLGVDNLRHLKPCFLGSTIHVEVSVRDARLTSNSDRGICTFVYEVVDSAGEKILTADMKFLLRVTPITAEVHS